MVSRAFPDEASESKSPGCIKSQDEFCRIYWPVIHLSLLHKHQFSHHDAEDLAQSFVTWILESGALGKSRQEKGRFRNFLLAHLDNFVRNHRQKLHSQKRGGGTHQVPLDEAEVLGAAPLADSRTPDQELQRAWSIATLREAHERIRKSYEARGKEQLFACLLPFLSAHEDERRAISAAASLKMSLSAFRMARSRFRKEFGQCVSDLVSATVETDQEFAEEMQHIREIAG